MTIPISSSGQKASATVTAVHPGGAPTVDVNLLGGQGAGLRYPAWYAPQVGDQVIVDWLGSQAYVADVFSGDGGGLSAASVMTAYTPGRQYASPGTGSATCGPAVDSCSATPFPVGRAARFDLIGAEVTAAAAGGLLRVGVYADNQQGGPGWLVLNAGAFPTTSTGLIQVSTQGLLLVPGLYWLAAQVEVAAGGFRSVTNTPGLAGVQAPAGGGVLDGYYATGVTPGALPNPYPSGTGQTANLPKVFLRAA